MTRRVSPGVSAIAPAGMSPGVPQAPTETSADEHLSPQVSGEIYPFGNEPDSQVSGRTGGKTSRSVRRTRRATGATSGRAGSEPGTVRLRVFVCNFCSTAEVVPWCGQNPNCGHLECSKALERCADSHRVDDRRFHGQVNVAIVERHVWERYAEKVAEEAS